MSFRNLSIAAVAVIFPTVLLFPSARAVDVPADGAATARPVAPTTHKLPLDVRAPASATDLAAGRPGLLTDQLNVGRFDAVGVSWDRAGSPDNAAVWVRVREPAGWSAWNPLAPLDIGPDGGTIESSLAAARVATEPLLTSGADGVQVRVDAAAPLNGLQAELIDAGRSPADGRAASATSAPTASGAPTMGASSVAAAGALPSGTPPRPAIISREQWGADESLRGHPPEYAPSVKVGIIHHTATTNSYSAAGAFAEIRAIYAYHTQSLGWSDIGYNLLVDQYGQIFEGRYGGLDRPVIGAATGGFNTSSTSVSALGNFQDAPTSAALVESISQVLAWKLAVSYVNPVGTSQLYSYGHPSSRYAEGQTATFPNIIGHRDAGYTACPGDYLYAYFDAIRNRVMQLTHAGLGHPDVATTPRTPGANGSARVTSELVYAGDWAVEVHRSDGSLLKAYTGAGSSLDVTWPMTDQLGLAVPEGMYQIVIKSNQNGTSALDFSAWTSTTGIIGNLDSVQPTPGGEFATGWVTASNGDTATAAITVDGGDPVRTTASDNRPDVAAAYPGLGPLHGFSVRIGVPVGVHSICLWGERSGLQGRLLACSQFDNPPNEPIGNVESVTSLYGGLRLSGWAIDRHTANPINTRFYVDGWWAGDPGAGLARPDVAGVYPAYGQNHGFDVSVNTGPGLHWVCVNGVNVGPGAGERLLGCAVAATKTGPPIGQFESLGVGSGSVTVNGWTFDPDVTAPIAIHVYADGRFLGAYAADGSRPDLSGPFPFMGTPHGFAATAGMATAGHHTVCVYAINAGPPDQNPLLGCQSFG